MKKRVLLASTLVLGSLLVGSVAQAAEVTTWPTTRTAEGTVSFLDSSPGSTEDPTKPGDKGKGGDGETTSDTGKLRIDYMSNFRFGEHKKVADGTQQTFYAKPDTFTSDTDNLTKNVALNVQLTDERADTTGGTPAEDAADQNKGWNLSVSVSDFKNGAHTLNAVMKLHNIDIKTVSTNPNGAETGMIPAAELTLTSSQQTLAKAEASKGKGKWFVTYGDAANYGYVTKGNSQEVAGSAEGASLTVTGDTGDVKDGTDYKATVTYSLNNVPTI